MPQRSLANCSRAHLGSYQTEQADRAELMGKTWANKGQKDYADPVKSLLSRHLAYLSNKWLVIRVSMRPYTRNSPEPIIMSLFQSAFMDIKLSHPYQVLKSVRPKHDQNAETTVAAITWSRSSLYDVISLSHRCAGILFFMIITDILQDSKLTGALQYFRNCFSYLYLC